MTDRPGFVEMLERLLSYGARTIVIESPDRFARDLMVQLAGHDMLKARGPKLLPITASATTNRRAGRSWRMFPKTNSRRPP